MPTPAAMPIPAGFVAALKLALTSESQQLWQAALDLAKEGLERAGMPDIPAAANDLAKQTGAEPRRVRAVLQVVLVLAWSTIRSEVNISEEEISAKIAAAAEQEGEALQEDQKALLRALVAKVKGSAAATKQAFLSGRAASGVLPKFVTLGATMELRSSRFVGLIGQPVPAAETAPMQLIPIASLLLKLDSGTPSEVFFQATEEDLAELQARIEELRAGLAELKGMVQLRTS